MTENKINNETQETQVTPNQKVVIDCIWAISNIKSVLHCLEQPTSILLKMINSVGGTKSMDNIGHIQMLTEHLRLTVYELGNIKLMDIQYLFELFLIRIEKQDTRSIKVIKDIINRVEALINDEITKLVDGALNLFYADTFDDDAYYDQIEEIESKTQREIIKVNEAINEIVCDFVQ